MTRERLKEYYMSIYDGRDELSSRWKPDIICEQVDLIFDYFENRSCENCKYHIKEICKNENSYCENTHIISDVFYCSEWERKL